MNKRITKLVMVFCGVIFLFGMCACGKTIDLNDYVEIEISGYEGYGTAEAVFDVDRFEEDYSKMKYKKRNKAYDFFYDSAAECIRSEFIHVSVDESEGLSEGDTVTLVWKCDESSIEELTGYSVKYKEVSTKVEELPDVPTFDAFKGVQVQFEGVSPNVTASVVRDDLTGPSENIYFSMDKQYNLSLGEVVTLRVANASEDDIEYYVDTCGAVPEVFEKEYIVEGVSAYDFKIEDIPQESMDKMDKQARDKFQAHVAQKWADTEEFKNMELLGNYLLTIKKDNNSISFNKDYNALYFVYKITAANESVTEGFEYYYYTLFKNVIVLPDGTCSVSLSDALVPEGRLYYYFGDKRIEGLVLERDRFWYVGYEDLDTMFNKLVISKIDEYDYESTVRE